MRVGQNPAKNIQQVVKPKRITVAVLSYIPTLHGYYTEALDVLKYCLESIWQNSDLPFDLMVFDNGSCSQTRDFLNQAQVDKKIQYLVLSQKNVGKGGAWNTMFSSAPGEIIAYCDGDAYLYPGWLSACIEVLETYPEVGMVTARPMRSYFGKLNTSTVQWAKKTNGVKIEEGQLIPYEQYQEFADTMGYSSSKVKKIYTETKDMRLTYKNLPVFVGANHFQFVGWKKILNQYVPFEMNKPLGQVQLLDAKINEAGYLRLMTSKPLVQNMSNRVPDEPVRIDRPKVNRIADIAFIKKILLWLHDRIFRLYFEG